MGDIIKLHEMTRKDALAIDLSCMYLARIRWPQIKTGRPVGNLAHQLHFESNQVKLYYTQAKLELGCLREGH